MLRRIRSLQPRRPSAVGDDELGPFPASGKGKEGTARQSASKSAPWSNGRTLVFTRAEVRVRIPAGQPKISGTVAALTAPVPDRKLGIWPLSRDRFYIALSGHPFNSGIWPHEHSPR
jgi:hypothetical protein